MTIGDLVAYVVLISVLATVAIAGWAAFNAPEGYEADDGWHPGREP